MFVDETIEAVAEYLRVKKPVIDESFSDGLSLRTVYEWETQVVPTDMMPCLMLGDSVAIVKDWVAAHYQIADVYEFEVNGYVTYHDNKANAKIIRNFASAVSRVFEHKDAEEIPMPIDEWKLVWLTDKPPAPEVEIGYAYIGDAFCRSFHMKLRYMLERSALIHGLS